MKLRAPLVAVLALVSSCSHGAPAGEGSSFSLALTGPSGTFNHDATVTATPSPADGSLAVRFLIDGALSGEAVGTPYTATLDFSHAWGGVHHVTALAGRADG